jgi:hypothetical protein
VTGADNQEEPLQSGGQGSKAQCMNMVGNEQHSQYQSELPRKQRFRKSNLLFQILSYQSYRTLHFHCNEKKFGMSIDRW